MTLFTCAGVSAAEPADSQIKGALYDIEKYEAQFAGQSSPNSATVNRTLKLLGLTRQRLDSSSNKSDPSWIEADSRLDALIGRLESLTNPPTANSSSAVAPPVARQAAQPAVSSPSMISQERVRIKKLIRDIASSTDTMDKNGVKPFQDSEYVGKQIGILKRFQESLAKFSAFPGDPDVVAAADAVATFQNMIVFGQDHAAKELEVLGDVQARMASLDNQLQKVPASPEWPYEGDSVSQWVVSIAQARQDAATSLQQLAVIRERAYLPDQRGTVGEGAAYDMQDANRLDAGFRNNVTEVDRSLEQFSADIDLQVSHVAGTLEFVEGLDPASEGDQTNAFLGVGSADEIRQRLADSKRLVTVALGFDKMLSREQLGSHTEALKRVDDAISEYESKHARALELVRMPDAVSTDKSLLSVARDTLENPDYEVGAIKRMVINSDKVHREMESSDVEYDKVDVSLSGKVTLSGTETTYHYSWDQFQVATAEPVGETHFIFYNTFKYFTSGASTTPLNRWVLSGRIQGPEIPEANIDRN